MSRRLQAECQVDQDGIGPRLAMVVLPSLIFLD